MPYSKATKNANTKIAMPYLIKKGWTVMQAAAIVGNLTAESYMHPKTPAGDDGSAVGLAQWRNERRSKFLEIIHKPVEKADLREQLDFVDWELKNTHKGAGQKLKLARTIEEATHMIDKFYERSFGKHLERRIKFAKEAYAGYMTEHSQKNLEHGLKESMDGSDPVSVEVDTKPVDSSGFPKKDSWLNRVKGKLLNK